MHKYLDTIFRGKFLKWNNEGRGERILGLFVKSLVEGSFKFDLPNGSLPIGYSLQLLFASHLLRFKWSQKTQLDLLFSSDLSHFRNWNFSKLKILMFKNNCYFLKKNFCDIHEQTSLYDIQSREMKVLRDIIVLLTVLIVKIIIYFSFQKSFFKYKKNC